HDQPFTRALERGGPPVAIRDPSELAPEIPIDGEVIGAILRARAGALLVAHPALGVAIPRARSPIICPEVSATVMLRWCEPALAIGAASVGAMFLILAPTIKQHLELLSRLAVAIHDRELSAAVQARRPGDQLIADVRRWELAVEGAAR
ncbi:MAG: hypothetical protein ABI467_12730, partial [Kofleriaceae bacterium]